MTNLSTRFFIIGCLVGGIGMWGWLQVSPTHNHDGHIHGDTHPIADPYDSEYHVHTDFHIVINGELLDLSGDEFQTTSLQTVHEHLHLHDNNGDTLHIHAEEQTFTAFLASINITLSDECITVDSDTNCTDEANELVLYVNGTPYTESFATYVPVDNDRVLLFYGETTSSDIPALLEAIPDDACYYSGTCPERGTPPPESCGITCEL